MIFLPAPAALGGHFCTSFFDDFFPQYAVGLLRGHVVDARVIVLGVLPIEVPGEIGVGLVVI